MVVVVIRKEVINAAVNHIKVGIKQIGYSNIKINKYCNPIKESN